MKTKKVRLVLSGILLLIVSSFFSCTSVHTELFIPADPEEIWSVLIDAQGYKEWNPVLVPIKGEIREGEILMYRMTQPHGEQSELEAEVIKIDERKKLNQYGGVPGLLTFDHTYLLEPADSGTLLIQHEEYRGIGVWFWDNSWVEPAYAKVNEALRERVMELKKRDSK